MSTPLGAARHLHADGHCPTLLLSAHQTPFGTRSLLAIAPDATIQLETGAGLPAIPPRLVHEAHGTGIWIGAIAYDAGLDLLGIAGRHPARDPALLAHYHRSCRARRADRHLGPIARAVRGTRPRRPTADQRRRGL